MKVILEHGDRAVELGMLPGIYEVDGKNPDSCGIETETHIVKGVLSVYQRTFGLEAKLLAQPTPPLVVIEALMWMVVQHCEASTDPNNPDGLVYGTRGLGSDETTLEILQEHGFAMPAGTGVTRLLWDKLRESQKS